MKQECNILEAAFDDIGMKKDASPSIASVTSGGSTNTVQTSNNAAKPATVDGSRRKFAQQILYSAQPEKDNIQKKVVVKKETPILQSTPSLASDFDKTREASETNGSKQQVETKEESRDTVSSPYRVVKFDLSADREKEEQFSSNLSEDGLPEHQVMIEQRLSTSMCNDKEMREGVYQNVGKAPQMALQKLQRSASKDYCDESTVPSVEATAAKNQGNDGSPFDQFFRFVEKSVCGKFSTHTNIRKKEEEAPLEEGDPFDCECVISDVQRSTQRKGATRVILQVKKVLKASKARRHNEEAPEFTSVPIALLERENSVIMSRKEIASNQLDDDTKEQDGGDGIVQKAEEKADDIREEPEPVSEQPAVVKYESANEMMSSRCRERLDDYHRENGRSVAIVKEVPAYSTKMTKSEIIERERLRAQYH
ncbi:MAG: hypothetical protein SGBAC_005838 [Bacillariaceae sp.]